MSMDKCPVCGYKDTTNNKPVTSEMNTYINDETGFTFGVINDNARYLVINGNKLRRSDLPEGSPIEEPKKEFLQALPSDVKAPVILRTDGPTLEEFVKAGYKAENYPPVGYAVNLVSVAKPTAPVTQTIAAPTTK